MTQHFFQVYGGNSFEQKKPDPIGIETLLGESGAARERTMMVGDSHVDIRTARNAGVQACGVSYGFQPETFGTSRPICWWTICCSSPITSQPLRSGD